LVNLSSFEKTGSNPSYSKNQFPSNHNFSLGDKNQNIRTSGSDGINLNSERVDIQPLETPIVGLSTKYDNGTMTGAYLKGLGDGLGSVGDMILNPVNTLNGMGNALLNLGDTYNAFNNLANDYFATIRNGDGQKFAYYTGNIIGVFAGSEVAGGAASRLSQAGKTAFMARHVTTSDGFLFGSIGFKTPVDLKVGLYSSENTLKYGVFQWSTIAPEVLTKNQWFGRRMLQITPEFQETLGPWSSQVIPQGTYLKIGLVGSQNGVGFGSWIQLYAPQGVNFIK